MYSYKIQRMLSKCLFIFDVIKGETIKITNYFRKIYKFYFCKKIKLGFTLLVL